MRVENNQFVDCGNGQPSSFVFDFNAGQSDHVVFRHNQFSSPSGKTRGVAQKEGTHRFDAGSNVFSGDNVAPGLVNRFEAQQPPGARPKATLAARLALRGRQLPPRPGGRARGWPPMQ